MKWRATCWLFGIVALAGILAALAANGRLSIRTDLLALLPTPRHNRLETVAMQQMTQFGERRVTILLASNVPGKRRRAVAAMARTLKSSHAFTQVMTQANDVLSPASQARLHHLYFRHRFHLLSPADARALNRLANAADDSAAAATARNHFIKRAQAHLYGLGVSGSGRFLDDPLGLADAYRNAAMPSPAPRLRLAGNGRFYVDNDHGKRFAVIFARTRHDPFSATADQNAVQTLHRARAAAHAVAPDADILISGVVRHAAAAARRARFEMSVIGSGSLLGILILMWLTFGSLRAFALSLIAVGGGVLAAVVVTDLVFGGIHVIALVFGASLVGVSIDYCLHFFAQRLDTPDAATALRRVRRPVALGLLTSVIAYGGMALAPFPALRQIAVFTAAGLVGAWLGMILLLPAASGPPPRANRALRFAQLWRSHGPARLAAGHERQVLWMLIGAMLPLAMLVAWQLTPDDDVRVLYNPPPGLVHTDHTVAHLLGSSLSTRAILIRGATPDAVLRHETVIVNALGTGRHAIATADAITQALPPPSVQRQNYAELAHTLYAPHGPVTHLLRQAGFDPQKIAAAQAAFHNARGRILPLKQWLNSPASQGLRSLWLGHIGQQYASLIRLRQVANQQALMTLIKSHPEATYIDRVARISSLMAHYRRLASLLLGLEYVLAWLFLCTVFGARGALALLVPPALASLSVLAIFAVTGATFSLFNLIGLILLLGLGADYGIFLRMAQPEQAAPMLAVGLSVLTTLLAFGLLALSHTPALHSFGLTLALGLTLTFLLASVLGTGAATTPRHTS